MFLSERREFPLAPCVAREKKNLMTARVSMLLKSRAPPTCFRACFLPGRAKDLPAPLYSVWQKPYLFILFNFLTHNAIGSVRLNKCYVVARKIRK